jgi:O-antigen ligase
MLTTFWLVLIYTVWPDRSLKRWIKTPICLGALLLCLYAVAISGRRSVYLSLFIGLAGLVLIFTMALKRHRLRIGAALLVSLFFLGLLYTRAEDFLPRGMFFQTRVGMITDRLQSASDAFSGASESGFMAMQADGIRAATHAHPILGIGWGVFYKYTLNPSRHEVHSTPLKFLAETGVLGLALYLVFLGLLILGSGRLALQMRGSPYAASYLVLAVAISSLTVSYMYNRHLTERTFWLLLLVFLVLEAFAYGYAKLESREMATGKLARAPLPRVAPSRGPRQFLPLSGYDRT